MIHRYPYTDFNEYNLDWCIERVKQLTSDWLETQEEWTGTQAEWTALYNYVHDYFDNLDVQEEINNKLDEMAGDGSLLNVIEGTVINYTGRTTEAWLQQNITQETGYVLDSSLTLANAAAPAKTVGDALTDVNNALDAVEKQFEFTYIKENLIFEHTNTSLSFDGTATSYTGANYSNQITISDYEYKTNIKFTGATWSGFPAIVFFNASDEKIATFPTEPIPSGQNYTNEIVDIPSGTDYFIVNNLNGIYATLKAPIVYLISSVNIKLSDIDLSEFNTSLQNSFSNVYTTTELVFNSANKFIHFDGVETPLNNANYSNNISINNFASKIIKFNGATWSGVPAIVFFNASDEKIATFPTEPIPSGQNYTNEIVDIPSGTDYFIVNNINGVYATLKAPIIENVSEYGTKGWNNYKWVCVGDSLTEVNQRTTKNYHDYIKDKTDINVVNMGVSGTGYARGSDTNNAFYQRILNCPVDADVITIFGSFNDLSAELDIGTATDTGTTTLGGCINTTLNNLFSIIPLANVGIITPCPWSWTNPADTTSSATQYCNLIIDICKRRSIPCLDLFHESLLRPWESSFRELAYSHDDGNGVHPDENGHKLIAPRFEGFLNSLLLSK